MIWIQCLMNWKVGMMLRNYNVVLTRRAKDDIIDVGDYIAYTLLEPGTAYKFVTGLRKAIDGLKMFPDRFGLIDDVVLASQQIRCMPYKNYYVFYQVIEAMETVLVLRVGYNRRNWKEILLK